MTQENNPVENAIQREITALMVLSEAMRTQLLEQNIPIAIKALAQARRELDRELFHARFGTTHIAALDLSSSTETRLLHAGFDTVEKVAFSPLAELAAVIGFEYQMVSVSIALASHGFAPRHLLRKDQIRHHKDDPNITLYDLCKIRGITDSGQTE